MIRVSVVGGIKIRSTVAWARTNDLGEYRFGQRAGGVYYLAVTGEPWYTARSQPLRIPGQEVESARSEPAQSYLPVYYPNANDPSSATPLEWAPGAEVTADFRLSITTGVNVHVHCAHPAGRSALITLLTDGAAGVETHQRQAWLFGNDQTIAGVLPGHYVVLVDGRNGNTSSGRKAIDVGQSDVVVDLTMEPAPTVGGKVVFKDPQRRPRRPAYVRLIDESNGGALARAIDPSGTFSFDNVPPSRRRVQLSARTVFCHRDRRRGRRAQWTRYRSRTGCGRSSQHCSCRRNRHAKGIRNERRPPCSWVLAVLAPKSDSKDPGAYRGFQTDSDGSFDYQNVRAGDYILFAIERLDFEYANPSAVRPYRGSGNRSTLLPMLLLSRTLRY